ncbi:3D domain-containing protein [Candidatus Uhrbacteria bacterium]|nr:3D domain-containing protein [Candidatus Uhrbacteria bacterium]
MASKKPKPKLKLKKLIKKLPVRFIFAVIVIAIAGFALKGWGSIGVRYISAYNSLPEQTDDTPCIAAKGDDICLYQLLGGNTCAANFLPIGTRLWVDGMGSCIVLDRMNARYTQRIDWYMGMDKEAAKAFGIQRREVWRKDNSWMRL